MTFCLYKDLPYSVGTVSIVCYLIFGRFTSVIPILYCRYRYLFFISRLVKLFICYQYLPYLLVDFYDYYILPLCVLCWCYRYVGMSYLLVDFGKMPLWRSIVGFWSFLFPGSWWIFMMLYPVFCCFHIFPFYKWIFMIVLTRWIFMIALFCCFHGEVQVLFIIQE